MGELIEDGKETSEDGLHNLVDVESIWSWASFDQGCGDGTGSREMESLESDVDLKLVFGLQGTQMGSGGYDNSTRIENKDNQETSQSINKNQNPYFTQGALMCLVGIEKNTQIRLGEGEI